MKECEKVRGAAEVKLQSEIRKLRKACEAAAPNERLVANLLASLDVALDTLVDSHVALVMKMGAHLNEARFTQYIARLEDAAEEVKTLAGVVTKSVDGDGVPLLKLDSGKLKQDYGRIVLSVETQLVGLKGLVQTALTKEQHGEMMQGVKELSDLLYVQLRKVCDDLEKALPTEVDRMKEEHNEFYDRVIPELEKLKLDLRIKKPPEIAEPARHQAPRIGEGATAQERVSQKQTVKFKPLDHPEFDGKAKNYSRFKQRFNEMITPNFDSMGQLEFLEKAIPKWVKERMSLIRKTPEQL